MPFNPVISTLFYSELDIQTSLQIFYKTIDIC